MLKGFVVTADAMQVARATHHLLARTARTTGLAFFRALVRGLAETLGTRDCLVGELGGSRGRLVHTLAFWSGDAFAADLTYDLCGTPCDNLMSGDLCHYPDGVSARFPSDELLVRFGVESYCGLPLKGSSGAPIGLLVAMHDRPTPPVGDFLASTLALFADRAAVELERMRSEAALARSEARYRQIVSSCLEGVWMIDTGGVTSFVNRQMAAMLGYTEAEMTGRSVFDFVDQAARPQLEQSLARRRAGLAEQHELRFRHRDGRVVWLLMSVTPLYGDGGDFAGALAMALDNTERRALEEGVRQAQKLESLGVLAGGVAHDFNNLLVGVLGNAEIALRSQGDVASLRPALTDIRTAALRAAELTRQLLAFSGGGRFVVSRVDLNAIISDMTRLLSTAVSKKVALRFEPAAPTAFVEADPGQIGQVVMNLIMNASEAIGDEPGTILVKTGTVSVDREELRHMVLDDGLAPGEYVFLEVSDTGCGMDAATRARLFDPFFTTKFTGRGLGLAAVLGVLRSHRGGIRVDSEPGQGSTLRVLLPRAAAAEAAAPASDDPADPASAEVPALILLVDDEAYVRKAAALLLGDAGYTLLHAVDGPDAVAQFRARMDEIALVVLDMTLPGLSGDQVFRELRALRPDVKVLLWSGYAEEAALQRIGEGSAGFLQKPWTADELLTAVRRALGR
jgi:two-component system, cell cycle sensor histidine kinase and response regulator CckA